MRKISTVFLVSLCVAILSGCSKPTIPPCDDKEVLNILKEQIIESFKAKCNPKDEYGDPYCFIKDGKFKNAVFMDTRRKHEGCIVKFISDYENMDFIMTYKTRYYDNYKKISVELMDNVSESIDNIFGF